MSNNAPSSPPSDEQPSPPQDLSASGLTIPSDSEAFSSLSPPSTSSPQSSSNNNNDNNGSHEQKVVIYGRPTFWSLLRGAAINLLLPFVNGMMLGLGELLAHEIAFRWGWGTTQVCRAYDWGPWDRKDLLFCRLIDHSLALILIYGVESKLTPFFLFQIFPKHRSSARTVGPGVEMREDPMERRKRQGDIDPDLMDTTSLE